MTGSLAFQNGGGDSFRYVLFWLNEDYPVILVLYDAQEDRAYWLHVQAYFRQHHRRPVRRARVTATVRVPLANVLDERAIRRFAQYRDEARA